MFLREFGTAFDIGEEKSDGASGDRYTASNLNDLLWHKYSVLQMKFIETFWFPGLVDVQSPLVGEIPRSGELPFGDDVATKGLWVPALPPKNIYECRSSSPQQNNWGWLSCLWKWRYPPSIG